jgi:hypothetical protein
MKHFLLLLSGVFFLQGSFVYLFDSALSGANILSVALVPVLCASIFLGGFSKGGLFALVGFSLFILLAITAIALNPNVENFRMLRAAIVAASGAYWGSWLSKRHSRIVFAIVGFGFFVALSIAILQIFFVRFGLGLDPSIRFIDGNFSSDKVFGSGYPSIFTNSNDFSVFSALVFLFCLFRKETLARVLMAFSILAVLLSGSKVAMIICFFGLVISLNRARAYVVFIFVLAIFFLFFDSIKEFENFYSFSRLMVTVREFIDGDLDQGSSLVIRAETYKFFILEYPRFLFGSFDASKVFPQFNYANFDISLMARNPHSMFIELHGLFGFFGLVVSSCLMIALWLKLSPNWSFLKSGFFFFSVLALTTISSSTLHIGSFFAMVAFLANRDDYQDEVLFKYR